MRVALEVRELSFLWFQVSAMEAQKRRERQQNCTQEKAPIVARRPHTDRRKSTDSTRVFVDQCDPQRHPSRTGPYHPRSPVTFACTCR